MPAGCCGWPDSGPFWREEFVILLARHRDGRSQKRGGTHRREIEKQRVKKLPLYREFRGGAVQGDGGRTGGSRPCSPRPIAALYRAKERAGTGEA